jgi:hypothetical protein
LVTSDQPHGRVAKYPDLDPGVTEAGGFFPCSARSLLPTTATYGIITLSESGGSR